MSQLHELLAVEKSSAEQAKKIFDDTMNKFQRVDTYFQGNIRTLEMISGEAEAVALQDAAKTQKELVTTVPETLAWMFKSWARHQDVKHQKNASNQHANADVLFRGEVLLKNMPIDTLLGLEAELEKVRGLVAAAPTLDASIKWEHNAVLGAFIWSAASPEVTIKTEKKTTPVVLYPATDKHPAQIKEVTADTPVGKFILQKFSGALTAQQKAEGLAATDELINEVKKARVRANQVEANTDRIGEIIAGIVMGAMGFKMQ